MTFFCVETGRLTFADGFLLYGGMPAQELGERYRTPQNGELTLCLGAHPVRGGSLAPICLLDSEGLGSVVLHVYQMGAKTSVSADRQRAFLFSALGMRDPCPDTRLTVKVRFPFGEVSLYSDPYTGGASARIEYSRQSGSAQA